MRNSIMELCEILKNSKHTVFLGGAGVSTESGVKDFRSPTGIYNTVTNYGISPEIILSRSYFKENPDVFYRFYREFFLGKVQPNAAHFALAELERKGLLSAVITQNVDGLHTLSGSRKVIELHGTASTFYCDKCGRLFKRAAAESIIEAGEVPRCEECRGVVRPKIVLYEERLPENALNEAVLEVSMADTLIVGGTSLAVYPAAGLLDQFRGKNLVIINLGETQRDELATLIIHEKIGDALSSVVRLL